MRTLQAILFLVFLLLILVFAIQNLETVAVAFLNFTLNLPKAALIVGAYILGAISGWSVFDFIKRSLQDVNQLRQSN